MPMKKSVRALGLAALVLLAASACSSGGGSTQSDGSDSAQTAEMEHIHGIGVDPENGYSHKVLGTRSSNPYRGTGLVPRTQPAGGS